MSQATNQNWIMKNGICALVRLFHYCFCQLRAIHFKCTFVRFDFKFTGYNKLCIILNGLELIVRLPLYRGTYIMLRLFIPVIGVATAL